MRPFVHRISNNKNNNKKQHPTIGNVFFSPATTPGKRPSLGGGDVRKDVAAAAAVAVNRFRSAVGFSAQNRTHNVQTI